MKKFSVRIPDIGYWKENIPCQYACPVHTDARGYVRAIAEGNFERAYLIARGPNPLASICGRVCGAPCETECRRRDIDEAVSIRVLKRYVCEQYGPEVRPDGGNTLVDFLKETARRHADRECEGREEILPLLQSIMQKRVRTEKTNGKSIGIIGAGPAGLAAAHDLALLGFAVTIYEMEPVLGGMLSVGIPEYRLPRDLIQAEADVVVAMGVQVVTDCCVGKDVSFDEIRKQHDSVIVAVGAKRSREATFPGADADGVLGGVEFLRDVSLGKEPALGRRILVVGGGDSAMDSARSALRVAAADDDADQYFAVDAARTASLFGGREVNIVYRRSRTEMPAIEMEIDEAEAEGIQLHLLTSPLRIEKDDQGRVKGMWCQKMELGEPDDSGRRKPVPIEGSDTFFECDNIIMAIGQVFDLSFIDPEKDGLKMTEWGTLECDAATGVTSAPDVYVAGDLAHGAKLVIDAVASGKAVARTIYEKIQGETLTTEDLELHFPADDGGREYDYEVQPRQTPCHVPHHQREARHDVPLELGFSDEQAAVESGRCLDCGINTIFDGEKCILCGGCADVCPELCLKLVSLDRLSGGQSPLDQVIDECTEDECVADCSAIIKDETRCIRCGACAVRCPVDAITMERFCFKEKLVASDTRQGGEINGYK